MLSTAKRSLWTVLFNSHSSPVKLLVLSTQEEKKDMKLGGGRAGIHRWVPDSEQGLLSGCCRASQVGEVRQRQTAGYGLWAQGGHHCSIDRAWAKPEGEPEGRV